MKIIFVRTRYDYDSYVDFWQIVGLSGFPIRYVDEVNVSEEAVFILSPINREWEAHMGTQRAADRRAHLVLWDLERPLPRGGLGQMKEHAQRYLDRRLFDEIWTSDRRLARECGFRFVVMGSDERLGAPLFKKKRYDLCHFSYLNVRRREMLGQLSHLRVAPNAWPPKRGRLLRSSKFGLAVHQDPQPYQEPLRLALFSAHGLPTVSEAVFDPYPWTERTAIFASYPDLKEAIEDALERDYRRYEEMGARAREMMCRHFQFRSQVLTAAERSVDSPVFLVGARKRSGWERMGRWLKHAFGVERRGK